MKIAGGRLSFAQQNSNAKLLRQLRVPVQSLREAGWRRRYPVERDGGSAQSHGRRGTAAGVESSAGLAGLLSIDGVAASNGKTLFLSGRLKAEQFKLARNGSPVREPVEFDFALEHDMRKNSGGVRRGEIHIRNAAASLTGSCVAH